MSTWVERDAETGEVLLRVQNNARQSKADPSLGRASSPTVRTLRMSRADAFTLAVRLAVACDEDAEGLVAAAQGVQRTVARGGAFLKELRDLFGETDGAKKP